MIHLYIHGGSENHGCEALVRTTAKILGQPVRLFSGHPEQDAKYGIEQVCEILPDPDAAVKRGSAEWFISAVQTKLTGKIDLQVRYRRKKLIDHISRGDICLSIGGDNYCYAGTDVLAAVNHNLRKKGAKTVLWGCSVEPELVGKPEIAKDLAGFDLITARESISYEALKQVNPNTVLVADPAFTLERKELPLPEGWLEGNMIGINASPLILQSGDGALVMEAYRKLMREILETTECGIALIPHVVCCGGSDLTPLCLLYEELKDTGRVVLIGDHNCMELKGYIARCRMFIGARTHATIAAYSSCVPTLVLGYSVKSRGIARDLFGSEGNYVLPVQKLSRKEELAEGFRWLLEHESEIRSHLQTIMPEYIQKAYQGVAAVERLR